MVYEVVYHYRRKMSNQTSNTAAKHSRPLPRGPHQLPREAVEQSQRNRILLAVTDVVAAKGWVATSVTDIVSRAGVSRSTFYQLFDDRLDCFLAANEMAYAGLMEGMRMQLAALASERELSIAERISTLLGAYIETLTNNPGLSRVFLVEVYAAGPEAIAQRRDSLAEFAELFLSGPSGGGETDTQVGPEIRVATEVLIAAISSYATNAVGADDIESLGGLHEKIMTLVEPLLTARG